MSFSFVFPVTSSTWLVLYDGIDTNAVEITMIILSINVFLFNAAHEPSNTPNITGTPVSKLTDATPFETSAQT